MADDSLIEHWRARLRLPAAGAEALEARLRAEIAALEAAGLDREEAFLVASRRVGRGDAALSREPWVAVGLAILAAIAVKLPELAGRVPGMDEGFYARNLSLFAFPLLAAYFAWKRALSPRRCAALALAFAAAAIAANAHAFAAGDPVEILMALHLPIALWLAIGIAHAGGRWRQAAARMDFVRFSGAMFLYYVLIALGGAVLMAFNFELFGSIGLDAEPAFERWLLPCGAMGAVLIAAWLVDTRQGPAESLAPLLTRLFTPLFTLLLLAFLATMTWSGRGPDFHRDLLIAFDLLLAVVAGLALYAIAGRDPARPPGAFDALQLVMLVAALLVDAAALWAIAGRIGELGLTANRSAALGEDLILLLDLAGSAVLYAGFLRGRTGFARLERWQVGFLPVYAGWAAFVVVVFPLVFGRGTG